MTNEYDFVEFRNQQKALPDAKQNKRLVEANAVLDYHFVDTYHLNAALLLYGEFTPALSPAVAIKDAVELHENAQGLRLLHNEYTLNVVQLELKLRAAKKMLATLGRALAKKEAQEVGE